MVLVQELGDVIAEAWGGQLVLFLSGVLRPQ